MEQPVNYFTSSPDIFVLGDGRGDRAGTVAQPRARHGFGLRRHLRPTRRLQGPIFNDFPLILIFYDRSYSSTNRGQNLINAGLFMLSPLS